MINLIKFMNYMYKNLPLMLSKTNIKIMNAFHPWDGGYNFFQ